MEKPVVVRTGWSTWITRLSLGALLFETVTGLVITFAAFHPAVEWSVLGHSAVGLLVLVPITWYLFAHWADYRRYSLSDVVLLGYLAGVALVVCAASGLVVTWQGAFGLRMSALWRNVHLISTFVLLATALPHGVLVYLRVRQRGVPAGRLVAHAGAATLVGLLMVAAGAALYSGSRYDNRPPEDYSYVYGEDRPFAPSLATTASGGFYDAESLAGSSTCGSAGCHLQILEEWQTSAHRYAAMDPLFQGVQKVMADQNGPESTRYCGGCHDPISLFSGSKNLYSEELTGEHGYQEGVSCLACHGVRETDLQGNANYVISQPAAYLWQWSEGGAGKWLGDFLIRTYPDEHQRLSKRAYKTPEYCAACHKQFIDQEVNRVGWVQLQNQYDNWRASHWFVEGIPQQTIECRECHMPLVASRDPAAGDAADYNRSPGDGKHRSHRFIAANTMVPAMLELPGWQEHVELTTRWLQGTFEIPEIADKWPSGPVVSVNLEVPETVAAGDKLPVRVVLTAHKVGHDFPTGPLDIIQSWVELAVTDDAGRTIFTSGARDERHFIAPGSFLFKAEPVDQHGNLIDRHNLWEMVGVRYRRALFPGYSDSVEYMVDCPSTVAPSEERPQGPGERSVRELEMSPPESPGSYRVTAILYYRKVDQFLLNYLLGEESGVTAPVIEMSRSEVTVQVAGTARQEAVGSATGRRDAPGLPAAAATGAAPGDR